MRWLLLFLLLPSIAMSNCEQWAQCNYIMESDGRYLPLSFYDVGQPFARIEIRGNKALLCFELVNDLGIITGAGCTVEDEEDIMGLLIPPYETYWNPVTEAIEFYDGLEGREERIRPFDVRLIRKQTGDTMFDDGIPEQ